MAINMSMFSLELKHGMLHSGTLMNLKHNCIPTQSEHVIKYNHEHNCVRGHVPFSHGLCLLDIMVHTQMHTNAHLHLISIYVLSKWRIKYKLKENQ